MIELSIRRDTMCPDSYFVVTDSGIVARFRKSGVGYIVWMYGRNMKREFSGLKDTLVYIENSFCRERARSAIHEGEAGRGLEAHPSRKKHR